MRNTDGLSLREVMAAATLGLSVDSVFVSGLVGRFKRMIKDCPMWKRVCLDSLIFRVTRLEPQA